MDRSRHFSGLLWLTLACWTLTTAGWIGSSAGHGLRARYFANAAFRDPAASTAIDHTVSTAGIFGRWKAAPPDAFSAEWNGFLTAARPGVHRIALRADGTAALYLDGSLALTIAPSSGEVDADRLPRMSESSMTIDMPEGPHNVQIRYARTGPGFGLELLWASGNRPLSTIPAWALTPGRGNHPVAWAPGLGRLWALESLWLLIVAGLGPPGDDCLGTCGRRARGSSLASSSSWCSRRSTSPARRGMPQA